MSIKEIVSASGMTQKAFAEYFGIPVRSIENWCNGARKCPVYLPPLLEYKLIKEKIIK